MCPIVTHMCRSTKKLSKLLYARIHSLEIFTIQAINAFFDEPFHSRLHFLLPVQHINPASRPFFCQYHRYCLGNGLTTRVAPTGSTAQPHTTRRLGSQTPRPQTNPMKLFALRHTHFGFLTNALLGEDSENLISSNFGGIVCRQNLIVDLLCGSPIIVIPP
ncbi:unnamed protein product [Periconia digitata]|uniref:Uncharacterized protein n=1 Tax=Periconia digitata TaxID=1303443 RepID=A0A9W4UW79_9PLEO|nr:unnamed protein product [Periconia digitata]